MNFIDKMVERFIKLNRRMKRWQRVVSVMAAVVVFATTYALILPAITLDRDTATAEPGIEVAASENEAGEAGTVFENTEEPAPEETAEEPEETEAPVEEIKEAPYGLMLHGLTGQILASYDGAFDDIAFLQALGDDLHISSARSEYRTVTDVYFSDEEYEGEKEDGKVYHYIYFNNDPRWRVLSTYFKKEKTYMFTELPDEEETETISAAGSDQASQSAAGTLAGAGAAGTSGAGGGYSQGESSTSTTTFDIMQVSKTFLKYVGDQDRFYEECFQYVLLKGGSGNIVGTMSSYEIIPEKEKATFTITLSTGGVIEGSYSRKKNAFSFGGL